MSTNNMKPDQVRHDGELWTVEIVILVKTLCLSSERSKESQTGGVFSFRNGRYELRTCHSERSEESQSSPDDYYKLRAF